MFGKIKDLKEMRDQAKKLQAALEEETLTLEENGVKLTMNGKFDIIDLEISEDLLTPERKEHLEGYIKTIHKNAIGKIQRQVAMKMQQMGGFPGLG